MGWLWQVVHVLLVECLKAPDFVRVWHFVHFALEWPLGLAWHFVQDLFLGWAVANVTPGFLWQV